MFIQRSDTCDSHWTVSLFLSEAAESVWNWNLGAIFALPQRREAGRSEGYSVWYRNSAFLRHKNKYLSSFPFQLLWPFGFFYLRPPPHPSSSSNLTLLSPSEGDSQAALRRKSTQTCLHFCEWKICVVKSCRPSFQRAAWGCTDSPERSGRTDWYKNITRLINTRKKTACLRFHRLFFLFYGKTIK